MITRLMIAGTLLYDQVVSVPSEPICIYQMGTANIFSACFTIAIIVPEDVPVTVFRCLPGQMCTLF